jgi:hypothetical protein
VLHKLLTDPAALNAVSEKAGRFVAERTGATERVVRVLSTHL